MLESGRFYWTRCEMRSVKLHCADARARFQSCLRLSEVHSHQIDTAGIVHRWAGAQLAPHAPLAP